MFGEMASDVSNYQFLALRLRAAGHPRTRNSYYVNIQTDGPITTDLWQHRLFFQRNDGGWEDVFVRLRIAPSVALPDFWPQIPFENFVLTNTGEISSYQMMMYRERVRTIGISLLGGNSGVEGPYELGVDSIRAVNEEDVTASLSKIPSPTISCGQELNGLQAHTQLQTAHNGRDSQYSHPPTE